MHAMRHMCYKEVIKVSCSVEFSAVLCYKITRRSQRDDTNVNVH